jgi:TolB-like protein
MAESRFMRLATLLLCLLALPALAASKPTVAVLYFDYQGERAEMKLLKKGLAQMLISDLSGLESVQIVERDRLQEVIEELELTGSDKFDPETAGRVGKLLGARYLVLGGYFEALGTLRVDARVVETETGRVIRSTGASSRPDEFLMLEQKLAEGLQGILQGLPTASAEPATEPGTAPAKPSPSPRPRKLTTRTALSYSRALDARDRKDVEAAKRELTQVVEEQPDFQLAATELAQLMK